MERRSICGALGSSFSYLSFPLVSFSLLVPPSPFFPSSPLDPRHTYSPPPHSCIFLELFARRPVFQGQDEIHQLEVIFRTTGTPSISTWPELHDLPWYELVKPKEALPSRLRESFSKYVFLSPPFSLTCVPVLTPADFAKQMAHPRRPRRRRSAPLSQPCLPSSLRRSPPHALLYDRSASTGNADCVRFSFSLPSLEVTKR